jgi:hypothetical protein
MLNGKAAKTNFIVFVWPDRGLTTIYHTQGEHASLTWQGLDYDLPHSRWTCQLDYDLPHSRWTCQLDLTGAWLWSTTRGEHASLTWQGLDYDLPHSRWTCQLDLTGAWLKKVYIVNPVYRGHSMESENVAIIYRLRLYAIFINWKNEAALYRQWFAVFALTHLPETIKTGFMKSENYERICLSK